MVDAAHSLLDLTSPANRLEALKGERRVQHSIRINDQVAGVFCLARRTRSRCRDCRSSLRRTALDPRLLIHLGRDSQRGVPCPIWAEFEPPCQADRRTDQSHYRNRQRHAGYHRGNGSPAGPCFRHHARILAEFAVALRTRRGEHAFRRTRSAARMPFIENCELRNCGLDCRRRTRYGCTAFQRGFSPSPPLICASSSGSF